MSRKNKLILTQLVLLNSFFCYSQEITKINIEFVNVDIETPFRIKCDNFNVYFQNEIDSVLINDNELILEFANEIKKLNKADLSKYSLPDTRIKIKLVYTDKISYLCIDRFVVEKDDGVYVLSESLRGLLKKNIFSERFPYAGDGL
jgi:hypothetical protein